MFSLLNVAKPLLVKNSTNLLPDNPVFRLHYRLTTGLLVIASILVSSYSYIDRSDSAIQCMAGGNFGHDKDVTKKIINNYCWISSTFTLPKYWEGAVGEDFAHFGVGPEGRDDEKVYHAYYQWVPLVLALQAAMFYFPHYVWKWMEGGRLRNIMVGLNNAMPNQNVRGLNDLADRNEKSLDDLANYIVERRKFNYEHKLWSAGFVFCECLNLVNVVGQMFLTDLFLGGSFSKFGLEVVSWINKNPEERVDPMSRVFPKMTKCLFHTYGASGTIQKFDALCILGMNIINEKIYIFLWFWLIILAIITAIQILSRIPQMMSSNVRNRLIILQNQGFRPNMSQKGSLGRVLDGLAYQDWMIIYSLSKIMQYSDFDKLMDKLADTMQDTLEHSQNGSDRGTMRSSDSFSSFIPKKNDGLSMTIPKYF